MFEFTFMLQCRHAVHIMENHGISSALRAVIIQDIRSAAINEEFHRIRDMVTLNPPKHHTWLETENALKELDKWSTDQAS